MTTGTSEPAEGEKGGADWNGACALAFALRLLGVPADPDQIRHRLAGRCAPADMLRYAREASVKARLSQCRFAQLVSVPLPAILVCRESRYLILGKVTATEALVQDPGCTHPELLTRAALEARWSGEVVQLTRRAGMAASLTGFGFGWFLQALAKYRRLFAEVVAASFFLQLFALVTPLFFQVVIDKVLVHHGLSTLAALTLGLVTVSVFDAVLGGLRTYLFAHTTNRIDVELGARLFRHLLALPMAYFGARRAGDSVARVRELETIRSFITSSSLTLVIDLFFALVFLAVMLFYSPGLTGIVLLSFPLYVGASVLVTPLLRRRLDEKFNRSAENQAFLVESVTGIETVKAMAVEPLMQRAWEEQLAAYVRASFEVLTLGNGGTQFVQLVAKLVTAAILFLGAREVIAGSISVGELVAFNMLAGQLAQPVLRLAQVWQDFQQARLSVARLGDILNAPPEPMSTGGHSALPAIRGEVRFEGVSFRYGLRGRPVLSDVTLVIPAGQVVGIVGASGSGKSTLTRLVQRFYVPEAGRVLVDGVDLGVVDVAWLRRQIGVVLQDNVLFNRSVRDNIALAQPGMAMEQVVVAARLAGAHEFILELPEGYDTVLGERGASLSGGQRQRIAIARALAVNPRILILDEATSALDYESEQAIQQNMRAITRGRTVLIVAHRLSAVRRCDRIITLEKGRVVEDGSHEELLAANGRYAALCRLQGAGDAA